MVICSRRAGIWLLPGLVAALSFVLSSSSQALPRYSGYVGCGHPSPGRHVCDDVSVRYISFTDRLGSSTLVRECQSHVGRTTRCRTFRTGPAGAVHRHTGGPLALGWDFYRWYVGGRLVRVWAVRDVPESS
jgi:hypothetical protein